MKLVSTSNGSLVSRIRKCFRDSLSANQGRLIENHEDGNEICRSVFCYPTPVRFRWFRKTDLVAPPGFSVLTETDCATVKANHHTSVLERDEGRSETNAVEQVARWTWSHVLILSIESLSPSDPKIVIRDTRRQAYLFRLASSRHGPLPELDDCRERQRAREEITDLTKSGERAEARHESVSALWQSFRRARYM